MGGAKGSLKTRAPEVIDAHVGTDGMTGAGVCPQPLEKSPTERQKGDNALLLGCESSEANIQN